MRALLLPVLLVALLAVQASAVSIEEFLANYSKTGEIGVWQPLSSKTGFYLLVSFEGKESMVLNETATGQYGVIQPREHIFLVLKEDFMIEIDLANRTRDICYDIAAFNASGQSWQALCSQYTGTDHYPCTNVSNCQYACLSVPLCKNVMGGLGEPFVNSILDWRQSHATLQGLVAASAANCSLLNASLSPKQDSARLRSSLWLASEEFAGFRANDLFNCNASYAKSYCFCNYSFSKTKLDSALEKATGLADDLEELDALSVRALRIDEETQKRVDRARQREANSRINQTLEEAGEKLNETEDAIAQSLARIEDSQLEAGAQRLRTLLAQAIQARNDENYDLANASLQEFFSLAQALEQNASDNSEIYWRVKNYSENASGAIAQSNATLAMPGDERLVEKLENASEKLGQALEGIEAEPILLSQAMAVQQSFLDIIQEADNLSQTAGEKHALDNETLVLEGELANLSSRAAAYNQSLDDSQVRESIMKAKNESFELNFSAARALLARAGTDYHELEGKLERKIAQINQAMQAISQAEAEMDAVSGKRWLYVIGPDLREAQDSLDQARLELYSDPARAMELADLALAKADFQGKRIASVCPFAYAVLLFTLLASLACFAEKDGCQQDQRDEE